jgi:hypothetical protein
VLVAVHGVGAPDRGDVLDALTAGHGGSFVRQDVVLDGVDVPAAIATDSSASFSTIYEVNWTDIGRPGRHAIGAMRHIVLLALAMLQARPIDSRPTAVVMGANRLVVEGFLFWCVWPALTTLLVRAAGGDLLRLVAAIAVPCVLMVVAAGHLKKYTWVANAGFIWAVVVIVFGVGAAGADADAWIRSAAFVYALGQVATVVVLSVALPVVLVASGPGVTWARRFACAALMYSPVVLATMAGSLLWVATLWLVPDTAVASWERRFLEGLGYRLDTVEWWATVAVGAIPVVCVPAIVHYLVRSWRGRVAGAVIPRWLTVIITIAPALLAVPSVLLLVGFSYNDAQDLPENVRVVTVYQQSVLRVLPYLLAAVGPVRMLFDVLGDVVFHVVPDTSRLSILERTAARLHAVLGHVVEEGVPITVLAHSQGSIVALETIKSGKYPVDLVTVGAPVHSLYKRFFGYAAPPAVAFTWKNLWRDGDYIGGPVAEPKIDAPSLGRGGHTGYWSDSRVWDHLRR